MCVLDSFIIAQRGGGLRQGDVEGEGAGGGVALSPAAVGSVLNGLAAAMGRPSSSGSYIWCAWCFGRVFLLCRVHGCSAPHERSA